MIASLRTDVLKYRTCLAACRLFWWNAIQVTKSGFHYVEAAYTENIILNRYPWVGLSNTITVLMTYECRTSSTSIFSFQKSKWFEKAETINERRNQPEIKAKNQSHVASLGRKCLWIYFAAPLEVSFIYCTLFMHVWGNISVRKSKAFFTCKRHCPAKVF